MSLRTSLRSVIFPPSRRRRRGSEPLVARLASGADGLPYPLVALDVELHGELLGTAGDDPTALHDVNPVGDDVVEQALVVGDDEGAEVRAAGSVHALRDDLEGVDVEAGVGLVEDRVAGLEHQ